MCNEVLTQADSCIKLHNNVGDEIEGEVMIIRLFSRYPHIQLNIQTTISTVLESMMNIQGGVLA